MSLDLEIKVESHFELDQNAYGYISHRVLIQTRVPQSRENLTQYMLGDFCYTEEEMKLAKVGKLPCCGFHALVRNPDRYEFELLSKKTQKEIKKKAKIWSGKVDKADLKEYIDTIPEDDFMLLCEMLIEPEMIYDDDPGTVGHVDIIQVKCGGKNKSEILAIADLEDNLFQAVSYFYAPIEADPNAALDLKPLVTVPSGIGRELEADGLVGAYHPQYRKGDFVSRIDDESLEIGYVHNFWYLEDIYVEPKYRGENFGLLATAIFLAQYATVDDLITTHPYPSHDYRDKYDEDIKRGIEDMKDYLGSLEMLDYDKEANLLWTNCYQEPEFLAEYLRHR